MKTHKRVLLLTAAVSTIVMFWLVPGINTARETKYTRIYEDTDAPAGDSVPLKETVQPSVEKQKKYKTETIKKDASLGDIKPRMFSRAIHFSEKELIEEAVSEVEIRSESDTVNELTITALDSAQVAAIDTVASLQ
jgi:hypothetical protein